MKLLPISAILLFVALFFTGCNEKGPDPQPSTPTVMTTAIMVGEDGAQPYILKEAYVSNSLYQSSRASFTVIGKLNNGSQLTLSFKQSTPTAGANHTDALTATLNGTTATQASGTTTRNPDTNTVAGSFTCTFPSGLKVDGVIADLVL
jgi:hypothetical protein